MKKTKLELLKKMIADGKTSQAIKILKNISIIDKEVENEIVLLSSQWAEYKRLQRLDLVPASDLEKQRNNINNRLLQIIDFSLNNKKLNSNIFKIITVVMGVGIVIVYLGYILYSKNDIITENNIPKQDSTEIKVQPKYDSSVTKLKPPKSNQQSTLSHQITKKESSTPLQSYANLRKSVKTAFYKSNQLQMSEVKNMITSQFEDISDAYFRPNFEKDFGSSLNHIDLEVLQGLEFPEQLNCICQIEEIIKYEKNETSNTWTAIGTVRVILYQLKKDKLLIVSDMMAGKGVQKTDALAVLEMQLLTSEKLNKIETSNCK